MVTAARQCALRRARGRRTSLARSGAALSALVATLRRDTPRRARSRARIRPDLTRGQCVADVRLLDA